MGRYPNVDRFKDRNGHERLYFRRHGKRTPLPGPIGSPEFEKAYAEAMASNPKQAPAKGTMRALVHEFRATSPRYVAVKDSTRRAYDQQLDEIIDCWGQFSVKELDRQTVNRLMANRADDKKRANRIHKRLRALMEYAVDIGWIKINPVGKDRPFKVKTDGFRCWPDTDIEKFHNHWPVGTKQRLAFDLLLYLGQRSVDTVSMSRNHIADGRIRVVQEKNDSAPLWIALHPDLRVTLDAGPVGGLYFIETAYGTPRSVKGFYNWMKAASREAGCDDDLSPHGLRKAACTWLIDMGATAAQACAVTGHKSVQEMERYIQERNQVRLADAAIALLPTRLPTRS